MAQYRWHNAVRTACILCVMLFGFMGVAQAGQAKYVILLIGDGMGMAQRNAAELYLAAQKGDTTPGIVKLNMSQLPVQGATTTYSIDSLITDSAAAGTAMASFGKVGVWSSAGYGKCCQSSARNRSCASGSTVSGTTGSDHDCVGNIGGESDREPCTSPAPCATAARVVVPNAITTAATTSDEKQINLDQLLRRKRPTC